ncbi:multiprotein bridging factor aMBF1 [Candidatus Woesearchaeota archaeon]|nr:multiprotein bridging factor aMBF1 [Candidatus Woesearchaeota archaeon]
MQCDMCGKETLLYKAIVEGTELNVCKSCCRYGRVIKERTFKPKSSQKIELVQREDTEERIVPDYAKLIKSKRESLNLSQEKLAKRIAEKESLLQKIEAGHIRPNMNLAKKLESFLKITLIEEVKTRQAPLQRSKSSALTIGDLIQIKKVKK